MCLHIHSIPKEEQAEDTIVVQRVKKLVEHGDDGSYFTPYAYASVPKNGFLIGYGKLSQPEQFLGGYSITKGCIHSHASYDNKRLFYRYEEICDAFAIGVIAYSKPMGSDHKKYHVASRVLAITNMVSVPFQQYIKTFKYGTSYTINLNDIKQYLPKNVLNNVQNGTYLYQK